MRDKKQTTVQRVARLERVSSMNYIKIIQLEKRAEFLLAKLEKPSLFVQFKDWVLGLKFKEEVKTQDEMLDEVLEGKKITDN